MNLSTQRTVETLQAVPTNAFHHAHQQDLRSQVRQWQSWARGARLQHPGAVLLLRFMVEEAGIGTGLSAADVAERLTLGPDTTEGDVRAALQWLARHPALITGMGPRYIATERGRRVIEVLDGVYEGLDAQPCRECRVPLPPGPNPRECPSCQAAHPAIERYALPAGHP